MEKTLTATLPNGKKITRKTKANYKFVAVALNPYSGEYEVQGWSSKNKFRPTAFVFNENAFEAHPGSWNEGHTARCLSRVEVPTTLLAVD